MINICVICTGKKPCLLSLSDEHRRILEAIVSPTLNLTQLQSIPLWICESCQSLINTVETFKNIALVGASHLLTRLASVKEEQNEHLLLEQPPLLPVKQDPDDLLEVKSFVECHVEQENEIPQVLDGDVKKECFDSDDDYSEPSAVTNIQESCQANHSTMLETARVDTAAYKPVVSLPTLVLHPLLVGGSRAPGDRPAGNLQVQLPTLRKKTVKVPTLTLLPLTLSRGDSDFDNNSEDNHKQKEQTCDDREISDAYAQGVAPPRVVDRNARPAKALCCHTCPYKTSDRDAIIRHDCSKIDIEQNKGGKEGESEAESKQVNPASRVKRRIRKPPGAYRCGECYVRFADAAALARHSDRKHKETQDLHVCGLCKKEFKTKSKHNFHMARHKRKESLSVDTIRPELFCAECDIQFHTNARYKAHLKSLKHNPKDTWQFKCDECGKIFVNNYELKSHVKFIHLNKPDYQCSQCHKVFRRRYLLQQHVDSVHEGKAKPRPHVCHVCAAAFTVRKTLTDHLATHSNVRPHACPLCPATFKFKAALYTHNRLKHLKIKGNWKKKPKKAKEEKKEPKTVEKSL